MQFSAVNTIKYLTLMELSLDKPVTTEEIRLQYRKLCLVYHPDQSNTRYKDGTKFKELKEARDYLTNYLDLVNKLISSNFSTINTQTQQANYYDNDSNQRRKANEDKKRAEETAQRNADEARRKSEDESRRKAAENQRQQAEQARQEQEYKEAAERKFREEKDRAEEENRRKRKEQRKEDLLYVWAERRKLLLATLIMIFLTLIMCGLIFLFDELIDFIF